MAVIASRFNDEVTTKLVAGARDALQQHAVSPDDITVVWVPGAWELPLTARRMLASGRWDALVAVGAVVRGQTPHFDYIAGECARGLAQASAEFGRPIGFGVLTCNTMRQAHARAGGAQGNRGWDAALAALELTDVFRRLDADAP